jgi:hypothetical protein
MHAMQVVKLVPGQVQVDVTVVISENITRELFVKIVMLIVKLALILVLNVYLVTPESFYSPIIVF